MHPKAFNVAKELLDTEKSYLDGLKTATRAFKLRLHVLIANYGATSAQPSPVVVGVTEDDINVIFNNIDVIAKLSEQLHADFSVLYHERCMVSYMGSTLLYFAPQFRIYQPYLENYDDAVKRLKQIREKNADFDLFLKVTEKCEGMSLESFLIMPVQRLPRYLLLLAELGKAVPATEEAAQDIQNATDKIKRIAALINISLKGKEEQMKILAIQQQFEKDDRYIELVQLNRYLVKDGVLKKRFSEKSRHLGKSQLYHFFLFNDILVYAALSKNLLKGTTFKLKKFYSVNEMTVASDVGPKNKERDIMLTVNALSVNRKQMILVTESAQERDEWIKAFMDAIVTAQETINVLKVENFDGSAHNASTTGSTLKTDATTPHKQNSFKGSKLHALIGVGQK